MPFKDEIRLRLLELKNEFVSGLLPQVIYEELCRKAVADGGDDPLVVSDESSFPVMRRRKPTRKEKVFAANIIIPKILCPIHECGKALKDIRGLSSHLLANHRQSIKDFIVMPEGSRNYIPKPEGWISFAELERDSSEIPAAPAEKDSLSTVVPVFDQHSAPSSSSTSSKTSECGDNIDSYTNESSDPSEASDVPKSERKNASLGIEQEALKRQRESDSLEESLDRAEPIPVEGLERGGMILETTGKIDQRKFNRGQAKRKSYDKHLKLQCIAMKDDGKSTDEIMRALNITKGHVEKWYSPKNRERTLERATIAFQTSSKTIQAIKDAAEAASIVNSQLVSSYPILFAPTNSNYSTVSSGVGNSNNSNSNANNMDGTRDDLTVPPLNSYQPTQLPGVSTMSMVGALSNYTASLSSNTTLLRDGQTLSVAVPSGLSVSAGNILGLSRKTLKKEKKRKMSQNSSTSVFLEKKAKRPPLSASVLLSKRPVHINPRGGNCSSDSDDEDGVMELLGESRTRKPSTTFATTPTVTSTTASATANGNAFATTTTSTTAAAVTATTAAAPAPSPTSSSTSSSATTSSSTSAPASSSA